jgi:hypothetical protein
MARNTQPKRTRAERELASGLIAAFLEQAILDGEIDPAEKSEEALQREFEDHMRAIAAALTEDDVVLKFGIDHRSTLLTQARRFATAGNDEIACLLYMTWIEHWANHTVIVGGRKVGLGDDEISQMVRQSSLHAKVGWLLSLLQLPSIHERHRTAVLRLAELRNAFVHYKWAAHDDAGMEQRDKQVRGALDPIEKTVTYLRRYERKNLLGNTSAAVQRYARVRTKRR